jgi:hypothetical protein
MAAIDGVIFATRSDCYKSYRKITPEGIVVHSSGCNNPNLKRYVQPDDGNLGVNYNRNSWNEPGQDVIPHATIGLNKNDEVKTYQVLPFDCACWCVGSGWKGSYNYDPAYIQFEILEDDLYDKDYCVKCYKKAVELCAYLCKKFGFGVDKIVSHHEAGQEGMGSQHVDPDNWWPKHGLSMNQFRNDVKAAIKGQSTSGGSSSGGSTKTKLYRVRKTWENVKSQIGAYSSLANAKEACIKGYSVFDWNGKCVYTNGGGSSTSMPKVVYKVYNGRWLHAVTSNTDYAGISNTSMQGFAIKATKGTVKYRVHIKGGQWLPWVNKCDTDDWNYGCAGYKGATIDGLEMKLEGASGYDIKYRVSVLNTTGYYSWVTGSEDDFAGVYGNTIDCVQAYVIKK